MKKIDIVIISILIIVSIVTIGIYNIVANERNKNSEELYAVIYLDGEIYKKVLLTEEEQIIELDTSYGQNEIHVYNYGVEMHKADCPDQVCVKTGFINKVGNRVVCLPNKVYVEIVGEAVPEVDDISS
ncbi:NusG domain II-containing protein [Clostridium sp. DL1XJH146]